MIYLLMDILILLKMLLNLFIIFFQLMVFQILLLIKIYFIIRDDNFLDFELTDFSDLSDTFTFNSCPNSFTYETCVEIAKCPLFDTKDDSYDASFSRNTKL